MNRTAILFLALAVMLAHMVAIHQTPDGEFAPPYDIAHVAFRLGRNLVHDAELAWNRGEGIFSSYPSLLWVGLCALAERLYVSPILVTQSVGMLCTLGSVLVLTQFSSERRSGLIAPLLLAGSGCAAAAGTSGTEAPLSMLLLTTTVLGFEHRRHTLQAVAGMLLAVTQPVATWVIAVLFVLELLDRPVDAEGRRRPRALLPAAAPFLALAGVMLLRHSVTGAWTTPTTDRLLAEPLGQVPLGLAYLWGFFTSSGSAPLLLVPLLLLSGRRRAGPGRRSLLIALAWFSGVVFTGGSDLPFWNALAPVLPIAFRAVQAAVTRLMDRRGEFQPFVFALLFLGGGASLAVSKVPGSIGPLHAEALHRAWMTPNRTLRDSYDTSHGRLGLLEEIRRVERLRQLGIYLREELPLSARIGTAWPGAIGYLSRRDVDDLMGRTTPAPGSDMTMPWTGSHRVDMAASLQRRFDILASVRLDLSKEESGGARQLDELRDWLGRPGQFRREVLADEVLVAILDAYDPVSVPVFTEGEPTDVPEPAPALILRREDLGLTPSLRLELDGDRLDVFAEHRSYPQVVELALLFEGDDGRRYVLRPSGEWVEPDTDGPIVRARTDLLLFETGARAVQLTSVRLPSAFGPGRAVVQLMDWGGGGRGDWPIGQPARIRR